MDESKLKKTIEYLTEQFKRGRPLLFTGAGFSRHAINLVGESIPTGTDLIKLIWELLYPGQEVEEGNQLQDVFEAAQIKMRNDLKELLINQLTVNPTKGDFELYIQLYSFPWFRSYTLNIDNLETVINIKNEFKRQLKQIDGYPEANASVDKYGSTADKLFVVHLNGVIENVPDSITFSRTQYAGRAKFVDTWYSIFAGEMASRPVVFIGTNIEEPSLWQHIEMRKPKGGRGVREQRPKSFLVVPSLPRTKVDLLKEFNVEWIPMGLEDFVQKVLVPSGGENQKGFEELIEQARESQETVDNDSKLFTVDLFLDKASKVGGDYTARNFLFGSEPSWRDIKNGGAAEREVVQEAYGKFNDLHSSEKNCVLLLTGTAGTGKTTVAKQLALTLHNDGKHIGWIDSEHRPHPSLIKKTLLAKDSPDILFIEDASMYGRHLESLIFELINEEKKITIVITLRSNSIERFLGSIQKNKSFSEITVPLLSDVDIVGILDVLDKFNCLGVLKGLVPIQRQTVLKGKCGRQLLIAMIEATSGKGFEEKCISEYEELTSSEKRYYEIATIATINRISITQGDLIIATDLQSNEDLSLLVNMINRGLFVERDHRLGLRHRVVAEKVFDHLIKSNAAAVPIAGLLFAACAKSNFSLGKAGTRPWRNIVSLLNHEFLYRACELAGAEYVYSSVEIILADHHHFWLQRGSLQVEYGNIKLAENFLNTAYSIEPQDRYIQVERSYMRLKLAYTDPQSEKSSEIAEEAIDDLIEIIEGNGAKDYYPYHVLGSQGLSWSRRGPLTEEKRTDLLKILNKVVDEGCKNHPQNKELKQLKGDIYKELLKVSVGLA